MAWSRYADGLLLPQQHKRFHNLNPLPSCSKPGLQARSGFRHMDELPIIPSYCGIGVMRIRVRLLQNGIVREIFAKELMFGVMVAFAAALFSITQRDLLDIKGLSEQIQPIGKNGVTVSADQHDQLSGRRCNAHI